MDSSEMTDESIEVRGTLSAEDLAIARKMHGRINKVMIGSAILILVLFAKIARDASGIRHSDSLTVEGFLVQAPLLLAVLWFAVTKIRWTPPEPAGSDIFRSITRTEVSTTTPQGNICFGWEEIIRSKRSDTLIILYVRTKPRVWIFPRRLFASDADWKQFAQWVELRTL